MKMICRVIMLLNQNANVPLPDCLDFYSLSSIPSIPNVDRTPKDVVLAMFFFQDSLQLNAAKSAIVISFHL